jgi:hypothetical protein
MDLRAADGERRHAESDSEERAAGEGGGRTRRTDETVGWHAGDACNPNANL